MVRAPNPLGPYTPAYCIKKESFAYISSILNIFCFNSCDLSKRQLKEQFGSLIRVDFQLWFYMTILLSFSAELCFYRLIPKTWTQDLHTSR